MARGAAHFTPIIRPRAALDEVDRLIVVTSANTSLANVEMAILGPQLSPPDAVADFRAAEPGDVASMHHSGGDPAPASDAVGRVGLFGPTTNIEDWVKLLADTGGVFRRSNAHGNSPLALSFRPANGTKIHRPVRATVMTPPLRLTPYPD